MADMHPIIGLPAFTDNYIWVINSAMTPSFTAIDPGDAMPVLKYASLNSLSLTTILLTHHHADHTGGVDALLKKFPHCVVYGPDDTRLPGSSLIAKNHELIPIENHQFEVINTPGHTSSHISYFEPTQKWLFCGDTLFSAGCGRVFDGTLEALYQSLLLYKNLPDNVQVFCAHEYTQKNLQFALTVEPNNQQCIQHLKTLKESKNLNSLPSTIALEKEINPFFRVDMPEVIAYAMQHGAISNAPLDVFALLRAQKNLF